MARSNGYSLPRITQLERSDRFDEVLGEARSRSDADRALVELLGDPALDTWFRIRAVAALGDVTGPDGSSALRREFVAGSAQFETAKPHDRAGYYDLMCACLWALGKREGPAATDVLVAGTAHASWHVRSYGFMILAAVGDDRAWNDMLASLARRLAKKITSERQADEAQLIIAYLARHCAGHADRCTRLAGLLRDRWSRLPDSVRYTAADQYPGVGPGGPLPAEIDFASYAPEAPWQPRPIAQLRWESQSSQTSEASHGHQG
jgi:HEAT repeat protein